MDFNSFRHRSPVCLAEFMPRHALERSERDEVLATASEKESSAGLRLGLRLGLSRSEATYRNYRNYRSVSKFLNLSVQE